MVRILELSAKPPHGLYSKKVNYLFDLNKIRFFSTTERELNSLQYSGDSTNFLCVILIHPLKPSSYWTVIRPLPQMKLLN